MTDPTGWQTVYLDTGNEDAARSLALSLGSDLKPGEYSAGSENYSFTAYTALPKHDDELWAYPVLSRFDCDRAEGLTAYKAVVATPYLRTPSNPSNKWAGQ